MKGWVDSQEEFLLRGRVPGRAARGLLGSPSFWGASEMCGRPPAAALPLPPWPVGFVCPWEVLKPLSCSPKIPKFSKTPRRDGARGAQREGWVWSLIWADGRGGGVGAGM